jgi:3-hydroxyacyl-[acyl-carrier-protein] dehydratase
MLQEQGFYTTLSLSEMGSGKYTIQVKLNPEHEIFSGHFPGNPVTPGACMIQMVKELTEGILGYKLRMKQASNVKFMALINPQTHPVLELDLEVAVEDELHVRVKNVSRFDGTTALKMNNSYVRL